MSSLPEDMDRIIRADLQRGIDQLAASVQAATDGMRAEVAYSLPTIRKVAMEVPLSTEMAMDYGLIPDTRPPVIISRRTRFRWWRQTQVSLVRTTLGEWVAGRKFPRRRVGPMSRRVPLTGWERAVVAAVCIAVGYATLILGIVADRAISTRQQTRNRARNLT